MMYQNIILFVNKFPPNLKQGLKEYGEKMGTVYTTALIADTKHIEKGKGTPDITIICDFSSPTKIEKALLPYKDAIIGVTCFGESNVAPLRAVIPHLPYINVPTSESLQWATNKIMMRRLFSAYNKEISPKFTVIHDQEEETIASIQKKVGYPLVMKPAGLAASLLVTLCFHEEELRKHLKKMFRTIKKMYAKERPHDFAKMRPDVLIEGFMDGEMYSIDGYVNNKGDVALCPFVHVKTGRHIGFDDFFNYSRITPTTLSKEEKEKGREITRQAIYALNLKNTTVHVELMKTDLGWKIIELGPRVGGFRQKMYELSYGINHELNDVINHIGGKPELAKKTKGHTCCLKLYAKTEGILDRIDGLKKIQKLASFHDIELQKKPGDMCRYAKHGDRCIGDITLFHQDRSQLLADVRRLEQHIKIIVKQKKEKSE